MNLDLLYLGPLLAGKDYLAKTIHFLFALGTAFLLLKYLNNRLSKVYGYLGALFFLSTPIIVKLSTTVYVDLGLVFFTTASLLLIFKWLEHKKSSSLILAGICCGLGIGTKYNGLLVLFLLTAAIPILYTRSGHVTPGERFSSLKPALLFLFCAFVAVSPWLVRNYLWTDNPFYPLFNGLFNGIAPPSTDDGPTRDSLQSVFARRYVLYGENIWQGLLLPIRIFFQGLDDSPRYFDGRLNPFLLFLPACAFLLRSQTRAAVAREKRTLLIFTVLYILFAMNTGVLRIRYLAPVVPPLVLLSMYGLANLFAWLDRLLSNSRLTRTILFVPVFIMLLLNGIYIAEVLNKYKPIKYLRGQVTRTEFITEFRPEYPVVQFANRNLGNDANILCIFMGWRGYYLDKKHIFDHPSKNPLFRAGLLKKNSSSAQLLNMLKENGITHIMLRRDLFYKWLQGVQADNGLETAQDFFNNRVIHLFSSENYSLYEIIFP
jgi:4-amino-4-deoxy-L-arabinose transferase-like glycosyltransferase